MAYPEEEAQKFVTEAVTDLVEFEFANGQHVYISNSKESEIINGEYVEYETTWDGNTYHWIDFKCGGFKNDLTGQPSEPSFTIASYNLWQLPSWQSATAGFDLRDFYGTIVYRQRLFYNTPTLVIPQRYYIKQVDKLDATEFQITLTGSLDGDGIQRPSARKLEL